ncbi:AMP-binding protein, partial [Rhizobiaceae sp. 2RAB30]
MMHAGLRQWAQREPDRPALIVDGGGTLTFLQIEERANVFARAIAATGLVRGDHMAAMVGNCADIVALCWGAYRSGVYLTPLPTTLTAAETAYIISDCEALLVVTHPEFAPIAAELPSLCPAVTFRSLGRGIATVRDWEPELSRYPVQPRENESPGSLMMYSSGTTGAPKGIMRALPGPGQAGQLPPFARDLVEIFGLDSATRYLSTAPLYHAAALRFVLAATAAGGTAVVMRKFEASRALQLIDLHGLTLTQWVPTMFRRLLDLPPETRSAFQGKKHHRAIHGAAPG